MKTIKEQLDLYPELGINYEEVAGCVRYRHKESDSAIGVWIPEGKVEEILGTLYTRGTFYEEAVLKNLLSAIEKNNLGEERLVSTAERYINVLLSDRDLGLHGWIPTAASQRALEAAVKYDVSEDLKTKAYLAVLNSNKDFLKNLPNGASERAVRRGCSERVLESSALFVE